MNKFAATIAAILLIAGILSAQTKVTISPERGDEAVYVDNTFAGLGSVVVYLPEGKHIVTVKENRLRWGSPVLTDTIEVKETPLELKYSFETGLIDANKQITVPGIGEEKIVTGKKNYAGFKTPFTETKWFKILLGASVVLGGSAAYFKLKADDYYDNYKESGDPGQLDKTETYDNISAVFLTALEINFGFLIYFFLSD